MEDPSSSIGILGLLASGLLSFAITLSETALMALPKERVKEWKEKGDRSASSLERLIENRKKLLGFLEFFQSLVAAFYFALLTLVTLKGIPLGPKEFPMAGFRPLTLFLLGFFVYVFLFQFFPRKLGHHHVDRFSRALGPSIALFFKLLGWVDTLLDGFSGILANLFGREPQNVQPSLSDEEIKMLVSLGKEEQLELEKEEKEMIESVMTFRETLVKEIMTPRIDMVCVDADTPLLGVLDIAIQHGYSKFPVYEGTIDNIVGIVYVKDLFRILRNGQGTTSLRDVVRKPFFVPESKKVDELLRDMQREKISMAIVVDEYGGTDGLVTMEDLVEEIVGEIADEHDTEMPDVLQLSEDTWLVDGQINLEDLNAELKLGLPTEEFETLGGYLYGLMGKVPKSGDRVETDHVILEVAVVHRQRISKVKLTRKPSSEQESAKEELS